MARDVFEEVKLRFLVVGHVHEDIDGCFGYLSKKLREKKLHFNKIDEGFHDLTRETIHSSINTRDSVFQILGPRLFERWPQNIGRAY
jgi:hypothetical protein